MQDKNYYIKLQNKLKSLPIGPGVYFHKDKDGDIIYVGKAAVLKNRVRQYFQSSKTMDAKTKTLVADIYDTDWVQTDSEIDALFLEAEMVKRYMPKYNILLRDDKSLIYIRIDMNNEWPYVSYTRNPSDDGAEYFGPYYNGLAIKNALRYLRRIFPYYAIKKPNARFVLAKRDLDQDLGLAPIDITSSEYKLNLRKLIGYIKGDRKEIINQLTKEMKIAAAKHEFEKAALIRNKLLALKSLQQKIMFGDKEFLDISKDEALRDLIELLDLGKVPGRIEGFDISHLSGTDVVASMVVFKNGVSDRSQYRKFKMKADQNDDYFNMAETIKRRFSNKNISTWGMPDLVLIDGGKGQLDAAITIRNSYDLQVPFIGLAKQQEQIVVKDISINEKVLEKLGGSYEKSESFVLINLPKSSNIVKLLQRIRDESHRFAISYHTSLKRRRQTKSMIDNVAGIGAKTKSKLIRKFGSVKALKSASKDEIVKLIGKSKAEKIIANL